MLATWIRNGVEVRSTQLSDEFDFVSYVDRYGEQCIPLFTIDPKNRLHPFTVENEAKPEATWTIVSLIRAETN